jgi:WD40 repeat protein/DNA-binding SARP family transcriptional activator
MDVRYCLHLLGPAVLHDVGSPAQRGASRKALALLAYLAGHSQPLARQHLAELLWAEKSEARGRRNLSRELSEIGAALPDLLIADFDAVRLSPDVWVDTAAFQELVDEPTRAARAVGHPGVPGRVGNATAPAAPAELDPARLAKAIELYRGEFMAGFYLDGCPEFESWLVRERERWRRQATEVLERLIAHAVRSDANELGQRYARRWLELEPWQEDAHRSLMLLLARNGRRAEALAQYEICRRLLADEFGVDPGTKTVALAERIRTGRLDREARRPGDKETGTAAAGLPVSVSPGLLVLPTPAQDWGTVPETEGFYGRADELATLRCWLVDERCRVVAILGMGGMGKTALASRAAEQSAHGYDAVVWRSLLNAPPLADVLRDCLPTFSAGSATELPARLDEQLALLLELFRRRRCLLILDNCESIMQPSARAGAYRPGYEGYGQLLRSVGERAHQSCVLLTSREQPQELALLQTAQPAIRSLSLAGLDGAAGRQILHARGLADGGPDHATLIARYSGNPLALQIVAETVKDVFGGDLTSFMREKALIFDDIRDVLDQQWSRLTTLEQDVLLWLAIEREPLALERLRANLLGGIAATTLLEALRSLRRRSLIEQRAAGFSLQNVVLEYVTERLIEQIATELESGCWVRFSSHALCKAQAKEYLRASQARLILEPIAERIVQRIGRAALEHNLRAGLAALREQATCAPSYAGGNLLNLLIHLNYDLRGYDFSGVSIWQADLRGAWLPEVNFQAADLTSTLFTDTVRGVERVAFSPDSALLAVSTIDGEIRLWSTSNWQMVGVCVAECGIMWSVCFSPDGRQIAGSAEDRNIYIWDVDTQQIRHVLTGHTSAIGFCAWSPDGALLASAGGWDRTVRLWDARSGTPVGVLDIPARFAACVAFSPDGTLLACSDWDGQITVWECRSQRCIRVLSCGAEVRLVSFNYTGTLLASAADRSAWLWDIGTGALVSVIDHAESPIHYVACSPTAPTLAIAVGRTVRICDERTGTIRQILQGHSDQVHSLAWRQDGAVLATWADETVRIWDAFTGENVASVRGYSAAVQSVAASPASDQLVSGSTSGRICIWDGQHWQLRSMLHAHSGSVRSLVFDPTGTTFASTGTDHTIRIWDANSSRVLHTLHAHGDAVQSVAFSPDGASLASGGEDCDIRIWDIRTGRVRQVLRGHQATIWCVAFSPDGLVLASGSSDRTVRLWHAGTGQLLGLLSDHADAVSVVTFDATGRYLISAGLDTIIRWWKTPIQGAEQVMSWHTSSQIKHIALNRDGTMLLARYYDDTIYVWEVASGEIQHRLRGHHGRVLSVAWFSDSTRLVSGGSDGTLRVWDARSGECLRVLHAPGPYAGMNIANTTGLTQEQRLALRDLGAVEQ